MGLKIKKKKSKESGTPNFLKTGKARRRAMKREEVKQKIRDEQRGKLWRFFIPTDKLEDVFKITFLDGALDEDGNLENPVFYEHSLKINGKWDNIVSCCEEEPDPLQEAGQEPYLAQVFTIINHTPYTDRNGKTHKNRKQLFVATRQTMKRLQKMATKRKGLAGCMFEVSRTTDKTPKVGDVFEFVKKRKKSELKALLIKKGVKEKEVDDLIKPADYKKELTYYTRKELIKMGIVDQRETLSTKSKRKNDDDVDDEL